ncbi:MAG TPA: hypothetical protein VM012_00370 [Flavitalea sp.]|nr:hypothetical protein [Flavitalea sp.]
MRRNSLLFFLLSFTIYADAQLNIQTGAQFYIQSGATVTVQGDILSNEDIQGPGLLLLKGSALQNFNLNGKTIQNLQIDNASNISFGGNAIIGSSLLFTNGKVLLNASDLRLLSTATLTGTDNTKYFITNNTGRLIRNAVDVSGFTFPVGFDATTYNPITLIQNGVVDDLGVRVLQNVLKNGTSGAALIKEAVDASWDINESTPGGSNLTMTANWNATDELPGFNRTKTGISLFDGIGWDLNKTMIVTASGSGPYSISRNNVTNLGPFAVGTRPVMTTLLVSPKVYLQGPYTSGGMMSDGLRSSGVIPLLEPYSTLSNFTHSGSGGGETIASSILAVTGTPANDIVDWVFAQLHDGTSGAVICTRSVLIQRDGDVVDVDGTGAVTPYINFAGELPASYYVSIRHRNHLGVRTNPSISLARSSTTLFNFSTSQSQAFPGSVPNPAMATLETGVFGLYGGNANGDLATRRTGPTSATNDFSSFLSFLGSNFVISGIYHRTDFNMDGTTRRTGPTPVTNDFSKFLSILGSAFIFTQPGF